MATEEDRLTHWRSSPFVPNPNGQLEQRIASALEYIATQLGDINLKMDYLRLEEAAIHAQFPQAEKKAP